MKIYCFEERGCSYYSFTKLGLEIHPSVTHRNSEMFAATCEKTCRKQPNNVDRFQNNKSIKRLELDRLTENVSDEILDKMRKALLAPQKRQATAMRKTETIWKIVERNGESTESNNKPVLSGAESAFEAAEVDDVTFIVDDDTRKTSSILIDEYESDRSE